MAVTSTPSGARAVGAAERLQDQRVGRRRQGHRHRRRDGRSDGRERSRGLSLAVRPARVHHGERLLQEGEPERRGQPAAEGRRGLVGRDRARPRHGVGDLPELQDRARRGQLGVDDGSRRGGEPGGEAGRHRRQQQLRRRREHVERRRSTRSYFNHPGVGHLRVVGRWRLRRRVSGGVAGRHRRRRHVAGEVDDERARLGRERVGLGGEQERRRRLGLLAVLDQAVVAEGHGLRQAHGRRRLGGRRSEHRRRRVPGRAWAVYGGTSAASPIVASIYALTGHGGDASVGAYAYNNTGNFFDVTSGANGSCSGSYLCTGGVGYDGPTGVGTPNAGAMIGRRRRPAAGGGTAAAWRRGRRRWRRHGRRRRRRRWRTGGAGGGGGGTNTCSHPICSTGTKLVVELRSRARPRSAPSTATAAVTRGTTSAWAK